jgi:hypothetical protein
MGVWLPGRWVSGYPAEGEDGCLATLRRAEPEYGCLATPPLRLPQIWVSGINPPKRLTVTVTAAAPGSGDGG